MNLRKIITVAVPVFILALALLFGSVILLRLFFIAVLLIAVSYLWTTLSLKRLSLCMAKPPDHLQVGDSFQREVTLSNAAKLPRLWLKLEDNSDLPGQNDATIVNIFGKSSYSWQTRFICTKRGKYHLGPINISAGDPFGIFKRLRTLGEAQDIIVYPTTVDLPHFKFSSFSDLSYGSGYQSAHHISPNASGVREFATGDSLHHIHWRTTARSGKVMVKTFDADRSYNTSKIGSIFLDMNEDSHFGRQEKASDEQAITIAASIIEKYLEGGMKVGMLASDEAHCLIEPERGEKHLWQMLDNLAMMKTTWKETLSESVLKHLDSFRDNPLAIFIVTTATPNLMETIHQLRSRVDSLVVILLDISTWNGRPLYNDLTRTLTWSGAQVYTVRKDDELAKALDSKRTHLHPVLVR